MANKQRRSARSLATAAGAAANLVTKVFHRQSEARLGPRDSVSAAAGRPAATTSPSLPPSFLLTSLIFSGSIVFCSIPRPCHVQCPRHHAMPQGMQVGMSNVCLLTTVPGISTPLHLPIRVRSVRSGRRDKSIIPKIYVKHFQNKIQCRFLHKSHYSAK